MSWRTVELEDVLTLKRGYDLPQSRREDGSVPIFSSSGNSGFHSSAMVEGPGVITGRYGTIGEVFYSTEDFWPLNTTLYVSDFKDMNKRFAYYLLKTVPWQAYQTASAVPGINRNHIAHCPVRVPDKLTQCRIVRVLADIDAQINNLVTTNGYLAEMCEALAATVESNGEGILADISMQVTEKATCSGSSLDSYVSTESLLSDKGGRQEASSLPATGKVTVYRTGDTLVSNIRPYFKKIWLADRDGTCSGDVIVFRAKEPRQAAYLYSLLRSDSFFEHVMAGSKGTKMPRGDKKQMMQYPVARGCDQGTLDALTAMVEQMGANSRENETLSGLRDILLPKLMAGEIDVPEVES